jgi:hypothetical protein
VPTAAHQLLAKLRATELVRVVLRMYFDRLIERARSTCRASHRTVLTTGGAHILPYAFIHAPVTVVKLRVLSFHWFY